MEEAASALKKSGASELQVTLALAESGRNADGTVSTVDSEANILPGGKAITLEGSFTARSTWFLYVYGLVFMTCQGLGSQLVKLWLPTVAISRGLTNGSSGGGTIAAMFFIEACGILTMGLIISSVSRGPGSADVKFMLRMGQASFFVAASGAVMLLLTHHIAIFSVLGGLHGIAQACAMNMVFPFLPQYLPASARGKLVAGLLMANYAGTVAGPLIGSTLLNCQCLPANQEYLVLLSTAACFYMMGLLGVVGIQRSIKDLAPCST
jgi:hypothetical protein